MPLQESEMFSPPTDNLYKFLAISGLIIVMFSSYYPFQKFHELSLLLIEVQADFEIAELQGHYSKNKLSLLEHQLDNLRKKLDTMEEGPNKEVVFEKLQGVYDDFYKVALESGKSSLNALKGSKKSKLLHEDNKLYYDMFLYGWLFGSIFAVSGFLLWYTRLHRPTDNQMLQVKEIEKKDVPSKSLIIHP
jgi:hypothetical protein